MQTLALYARPVAPVAVDYLLQPYMPSVDSAPVLNRLVNMQFVHKEAGQYYLHPVDRDYAFARIDHSPPHSTSGKGEQNSPLLEGEGLGERSAWTQHALLTRAADYFAQARKPRESWKTLADLEPQLNEFDLRCAADDYDTAASVLLEIDGEYLLLWGHYRLMIEMHERLIGRIKDNYSNQYSVGKLGSAYAMIGQTRRAIEFQEQALSMAREMKDRTGEGAWLGNLGNRYAELGDTRLAITFYEQALAIARDIGNKQGEGTQLGNLGNRYAELGDTHRAITFYEQALAITRDTGDKRMESFDLSNLADEFIYQSKLGAAIDSYDQAIYIAESGVITVQNYARWGLALAHLYAGNLPAARAAAEAARKYEEPRNNHNVLALFGIIALRQGDNTAAQEAFTAAVQQADMLLERSAQNYDALDAKGLALCGLELVETHGGALLQDAITSFRAACAINRDPGVVARVVRLLDALALADSRGAEKLTEVRKAANGE